MLDSNAVTKVQSAILISVVIIATIGGAIVYVLLSGQEQSSETIKIGLFMDIGTPFGRDGWQSVVLAAEQLNDEGGILGREVEVVSEGVTAGMEVDQIISTLARLITYHEVDFIIGGSGGLGYTVQDLMAEHKIIFIEVSDSGDEYTQRVLDDYESGKYYFRVTFNATSIFLGITDSLELIREQTGFNKVGYLGEKFWTTEIMEGLDYALPEEHGFDLVYKGTFPADTVDFSSYFAKAEAAGVEILMPLIALNTAIPFVKEYNTRQSPMVIYAGVLGGGVSGPEGWEITGGKCEYAASALDPATAGYPLTSVTLPFRDAYMDRWGEIPDLTGCRAYDVLRYILPDAIRRAGTFDVDAVIQALESTSVETTRARSFSFTSSHDLMMANPNNPDDDNSLVIYFQWVDGEQVPVYPKKIMEEAGVTYTYPDWPGPWD